MRRTNVYLKMTQCKNDIMTLVSLHMSCIRGWGRGLNCYSCLYGELIGSKPKHVCRHVSMTTSACKDFGRAKLIFYNVSPKRLSAIVV